MLSRWEARVCMASAKRGANPLGAVKTCERTGQAHSSPDPVDGATGTEGGKNGVLEQRSPEQGVRGCGVLDWGSTGDFEERLAAA